MDWWLVVSWAVVMIGGNYYGLKAMRRLSPYGRERRWRIYLWSKLFAGRENFTDEGWRYRNIALLFLLAWPVLCVVWLVTT